MVAINPLCRKCFSEKGYSQVLMQDVATQQWLCTKNPGHKYAMQDDGTLMTITD